MKKYQLCKKFNKDIWGAVALKGKQNKFTEKFLNKQLVSESVRAKDVTLFNSLTSSKRQKRLRALALVLQKRRELLTFYGIRKKYNLSKVYKKSKKGVLTVLERRLGVLVYRLNFSSSILEGYSLCRGGRFLVNKEVIFDGDFVVKPGSVIEVALPFKLDLFNKFKHRLVNNEILLVCPRYLEVDYSTMCGVLWRKPLLSGKNLNQVNIKINYGRFWSLNRPLPGESFNEIAHPFSVNSEKFLYSILDYNKKIRFG